MKIKRYKLISLAIVLLAIFLFFITVGCSSVEKGITYDNRTNIRDVKKVELTEKIEQLSVPSEIGSFMSVCYRIEDLKSEGIVDIVRFNKGRFYSVTPVEDDRYLFLLYTDDDSHCVVDGYLASGFADKEYFKDIKIGTERDKILKKDKNAYVSDNRSYHRFSDGTIMVISYSKKEDGRYTVSDYYSYSADESKDDLYRESVVNYLLPEDLELL